MNTTLSNNRATLQIPFHKLEAVPDEVLIIKNKAILNRQFLFTLILISGISILFWTLLKKSPQAFQKPIDTKGALLLSGVALFIIVTLFLSTKRFKRLISNSRLTKQGALFLNGKKVSALTGGKKTHIVVQDVGASDAGGSFTVGLSVGRKFWGLCYELSKEDATKVAKFLSSHLGLEMEYREAVFFPLFKLH